MLATRIIPCLDIKDGRVVKGVNFINLRDAGDPVEQARLYDAQGADELVFLDISATHVREILDRGHAHGAERKVLRLYLQNAEGGRGNSLLETFAAQKDVFVF